MSIPKAASKGRDPNHFLNAFKRGLQQCSVQAQQYGACVAGKVPAVERGVCEKEFAALKACMRHSLKGK
eukprot:jgi/Mesen1/4046/ME000213S03069